MQPIARTSDSVRRAALSMLVALQSGGVACGGAESAEQSGVPPIAYIQRTLKDMQMIRFPDTEAMTRVAFCTTHEEQQLKVEITGFLIDRAPVSCADYEVCVLGGKCKPLATPWGCTANVAVATMENAIRYCVWWREARIPDWEEWQRAVRGIANEPFPTGATWKPERGCLQPTFRSEPFRPRCNQVSKAGISYATRNSNFGEWVISQLPCRTDRDDPGPLGGDVAVDLQGQRLDLITTSFREAEFRCARGLDDR